MSLFSLSLSSFPKFAEIEMVGRNGGGDGGKVEPPPPNF